MASVANEDIRTPPQAAGSRRGVHPAADARVVGLGRLYVLAAAVLAALVPLVLLAGLWVRSELARGRRDVEEVVQTGAATLAQQVETTLRQQLSVLEAIAALPSLDGPDLDAFHADARRMLEAMPRWAALGLVEAETGEQVVNTSRPVGSVLPPTAAPELVREVARTGRAAVHTRGPTPGAVSEERMVILYVPVRRGGSVRHVVGAGMRAAALQELAEAGAERGRFLTLVVDEKERVLARSRAPERYLGEPASEALSRTDRDIAENTQYQAETRAERERTVKHLALLDSVLPRFGK